MVILLFILFFFLFVGNLIISRNNIFSPGVVTTAVWMFCLMLYLVLKHNLPAFSHQFLISLSLWVFVYVFSSMFMQIPKYSTSFNYKPSKLILDVYFIISVITFPLLIVFAYQAITLSSDVNWALSLRNSAIGKTEHFTEMLDAPYFIIWNAAYLIELFYFSKKNKYRVFILAFFILTYGFITMSKYSFLDFFLRTVCILYLSNKVSLKHLIIGLLSLLVFFVGLQSIRHSLDMSSSSARGHFLVLYLVGNMSAFDTLESASSIHFGENTFRVFYSILYKLGISNIKPVDVILAWIDKPIATNTYTGMYPFFKDFGYWGVGSFALFFGTIFGWLFKKAQQTLPFYKIVYAFFICIIVAQYVGDVFFTGIAGHIKAVLVLLFPFLATKYKWFFLRKNKIK